VEGKIPLLRQEGLRGVMRYGNNPLVSPLFQGGEKIAWPGTRAEILNNNKGQNPNEKRNWFWHLSIWILTLGFLQGNDRKGKGRRMIGRGEELTKVVPFSH